MYDEVRRIGHSIIQHGKYNNRIYLMKLHESDAEFILKEINYLVQKNGYTKIFAKTPSKLFHYFQQEGGYSVEAEIPLFYNGVEDCLFIAKYLDEERKIITRKDQEKINQVLRTAKEKNISQKPIHTQEFILKILNKSHINDLAKLYGRVFTSYPFPIFSPEYLSETLEGNVKYFGAFYENALVAASAAEMDINSGSVEMTDFATNPRYRGNTLASRLLLLMEQEMSEHDIQTYYTIARALSYGMNITFSKAGYSYSGTLKNNTNISGKIESMNVWFKKKTTMNDRN
ncbi:MAG: putative beta-lysine N-acetyltransferase [Candidatus Altiarchaeota archaeon]|nr:putative beta-lysine N-acetyltransferase [Candidatus Altiarchaeota archaeon]